MYQPRLFITVSSFVLLQVSCYYFTKMPTYTSAEYVEMIILYGECGRSALETSRRYRDLFPNREHYPCHNVILRAINRLRVTGNVQPVKAERAGRPRQVRTVRNEELVLDEVYADPETSTRKLERRLHISRATINNITRGENLHPYHMQKVHKLEPGDNALRIQFCRSILRLNQEDPNFLRSVLWTDESLFTREGCFNQHNTHYYAMENPRQTRNRGFQYRWKINMWGGIIGDCILLYELPETMNVSFGLFYNLLYYFEYCSGNNIMIV